MTHSFLIRVKSIYHTLKPAEKRAADYMISQPEKVAANSVVVTARAAGCSGATLTRISRKLGYGGYAELRSAIVSGNEESEEAYGDLSPQDSEVEIAKKIFGASVRTLNDTLDLLDDRAYSAAAHLLAGATRYLFLGVGDAYVVAYTAYLKFLRLDLNARCPRDYDVQLIEASMLREGDVVLVVSHSGRTSSLCEVVKRARKMGAKVVTITDYPASPIAKQSNIVLKTAVFRSQSVGEVIAKRIPALCVVECLYVNLMLRRKDLPALRKSEDSLQANKIPRSGAAAKVRRR